MKDSDKIYILSILFALLQGSFSVASYMAGDPFGVHLAFFVFAYAPAMIVLLSLAGVWAKIEKEEKQ